MPHPKETNSQGERNCDGEKQESSACTRHVARRVWHFPECRSVFVTSVHGADPLGRSRLSCGPTLLFRNIRYITGTKIKVAKVAKPSPPITARARGAFCSPPSPIPNAFENIPSSIAPAVINTGRRLL